MLIAELMVAAAVATSPAPPAQAEPARIYREQAPRIDRCKGGSTLQAAGKVAPPSAHRLGDLPKANFERAVLVTENGCVKPQVVRYRAGR